MKDIASLPILPSPRQLVRYESSRIYVWNEASHLLLFGDADLTHQTILVFDEVVRIYHEGTDRLGMRPHNFHTFHIEPKKKISLWLYEAFPFQPEAGRDGQAVLTPEWMVKMKPVLEAAIQHALDKPDVDQLFLPDSGPRGWKYGMMCDG